MMLASAGGAPVIPDKWFVNESLVRTNTLNDYNP
jgi:hypothetical protein